MALFDDILSDVYVLTNRPDLVGESKLGVRAATIKLHSLEFWREDRVEEELAVITADNQFSLSAVAGVTGDFLHVPRANGILFKKTTSDDFFEQIDPKQLLDGYGYRKYNVYYRAGSNYVFFTDTQDTSVIASYYRQPVATEVGYDSWIATMYQHFIAIEAALFVANAIGDKELEARMSNLAVVNLAQLNINHLDNA